MLDTLRNWRVRRTVARHPITEPLWQEALRRCAPARRLGASDQAALRVLATLFLESKSLEPVQGLELDDADRVLLATHACLPILKLGLDWYDGWHSVIVYPDAFVPRRTHTDAAGVVHETRSAMAGEAWGRGPVILSWADVLHAGTKPGHNVVIHEMAHKLDMLNGDANGFPPLHRRMDRHEWTQVFSGAWERLRDDHRNGLPLPIDPYGLESEAEFFAVSASSFSTSRRRCACTCRRSIDSSNGFTGSIRTDARPARFRTHGTHGCSAAEVAPRAPARPQPDAAKLCR